MGECDKDTTFEILDYFYDQGGNFIDTANNYQNEESETWIGEWMEKRGVRDQMVLATKVRTSMMIMLSFAKNWPVHHGVSVRDRFEGHSKQLHRKQREEPSPQPGGQSEEAQDKLR